MAVTAEKKRQSPERLCRIVVWLNEYVWCQIIPIQGGGGKKNNDSMPTMLSWDIDIHIASQMLVFDVALKMMVTRIDMPVVIVVFPAAVSSNFYD